MDFYRKYLDDMCDKIASVDLSMLDEATRLLTIGCQEGGRVIIAGNGGSASIASHVSVDLTKNTGITAVNFNETSLITCLANDYGYEQWIVKALEFYANHNDTLILISSSGQSDNIINASQKASQMGIRLITFSGFKPDNPLRSAGEVNFWVDSHSYNIVEMTHQIWLMSIVDKLIEDAKMQKCWLLSESTVRNI